METGVVIAVIIGIGLILFGVNARRKNMKIASNGSTNNETWVDVDASIISGTRFREAVTQGNKIEAIKIYSKLSGVGLKEAKDAVDAIMEDPSILADLPISGTMPAEPTVTDGEIIKDAGFRQALSRKNKIEAIKIYRNLTGLGLKEAKDAVEAIVANPAYTFSQPEVSVRSATTTVIPDEAKATIHELILKGNKIGAIKVYRDATGAGLKEAKDAVEQIEREIK